MASRSWGSLDVQARYTDEGKLQNSHASRPSRFLFHDTDSHGATAVVTLETMNAPAGLPLTKRQILLTKANPTVLIGRTSKRNPDYEATKVNAYFESAVISREHGQLHADFDTQVRFP